MKKIFFLSILSFLLICENLYADGQNFQCNDLYGNCNVPETLDSTDYKNTQNTNTQDTQDSIIIQQSPPKSLESTSQETQGSTIDPTISQTPQSTQPQQLTKSNLNLAHIKNNESSKNHVVADNALLPSDFNKKKRSFLYSIVLLTALFDNGVQKQGYGILIKDGYVLSAADLMNEKGAFLKNIVAKVQDDTSNSLICFAKLRLRATDNKLSLLRAENYTDIYCNTRPESFYHQRINLLYYTPVYSEAFKRTVLGKNDNVLFPFVTESNTFAYKKSNIANIQKHSAVYGMPLFNTSGGFVGFFYTLNNANDSKKRKNIVVSSSEVRSFICYIANNRLLPTTDLVRSCK